VHSKKRGDRVKKTVEELLETSNVEATMVVLLTKDGERLYLHHFAGDVEALEYLEQMTALYRVDMIEKALKRGLN
jgi:hypothetical protein